MKNLVATFACRSERPTTQKTGTQVSHCVRLPTIARDRRLWTLLTGTLITLGMAVALKGPCADHAWDGFQYSNLCYNDIQPLYGGRAMDMDVFPYVGGDGTNGDGSPRGFVEYPVLIGLLMYLAALLSTNGD